MLYMVRKPVLCAKDIFSPQLSMTTQSTAVSRQTRHTFTFFRKFDVSKSITSEISVRYVQMGPRLKQLKTRFLPVTNSTMLPIRKPTKIADKLLLFF